MDFVPAYSETDQSAALGRVHLSVTIIIVGDGAPTPACLLETYFACNIVLTYVLQT